jgi:hypothetical protein
MTEYRARRTMRVIQEALIDAEDVPGAVHEARDPNMCWKDTSEQLVSLAVTEVGEEPQPRGVYVTPAGDLDTRPEASARSAGGTITPPKVRARELNAHMLLQIEQMPMAAKLWAVTALAQVQKSTEHNPVRSSLITLLTAIIANATEFSDAES